MSDWNVCQTFSHHLSNFGAGHFAELCALFLNSLAHFAYIKNDMSLIKELSINGGTIYILLWYV